MKRLEIQETQYIDLEMSIDNAISELNNLKDQGWEGIGYDYDNDGSYEMIVYRTRLETDAEFEKRKKILDKENEKQKILKQKRKERDLKEYLRLKNMFEKEVN
jgi:hypothetical protein